MLEETVKTTDLTLDQIKPEIKSPDNHHFSHGCLNCATPVVQNFCPNCGQKVAIHRYSIVHFVEHDLVHGIWHVDKGILFTIKKLFTKPGHSVREYIQGKRANYFNFVTLILTILAAAALLAPYVHVKLADLMPWSDKNTINALEQWMAKYPKLFAVITIPTNSLFSYLWFRKSRLNYSENLVANSYKTAAELIIGLFSSVIMIFYTNIKGLTIVYFMIITPIIFIYGIWYYYQLFSAYGYSKKALFFRSVMTIISCTLLPAVIGFVLAIIQKLTH
ncbi:DUF3667 domain-containing protein [Pedobacter frigidisoli]|uniref:DUF3667 domain-containing protein n=1 Tax=Pedobacter frigidisoli TaxID=2530455 RepID=A0A4R0NJ95_9SPHI|nr:DUF3667 domain-containing protein [Pedobacter frigidisoli]TCD00762.1 DUF3667 domain-containing protein [Pedobacter frigidisoli]